LNYFNDFDTPVVFPNGSTPYRKIIMVFTLGKYQCPAGTQYCGDWDYTIQNFLMTPTDTFELARLITPYANASYPRTPWDWKERYYFDVTEFYPYLKNNAVIRLRYHNYSGGFTGNIRFAFIEGTPPRPVTGITKLWSGAFNYGDVNNPIENKVAAINITAPAGTTSAEMRFTVTGHGADNNGCSEFCSRYYRVKQNSNVLVQKNIWKDDCGYNDLYPQSGTWIYNRANWCPGEQVLPARHAFTGITAGSSYAADVDFQEYTVSGSGNPSYIVSGMMVHYGDYAFAVDASLEEIISPTDYEGNFRSNPTCGKPAVRVKNTGSTAINSVTFQYGVNGLPLQTYTASGLTIFPNGEQLITLPEIPGMAGMNASSNATFSVNIQQVNGGADPHSHNNALTSVFSTAPIWPAQFNMVMKTNNLGTQTRWRIEDLAGNVIIQRNPVSPQTTHNDAVPALSNGCYRLVVTDDGCDGLYWWANAGSTGTGWIYAQESNGSILPFTNGLPSYPSGQSQDFGCGFTQYFRVTAGVPTPVHTVRTGNMELSVNPSPFTSSLHVTIGSLRPAPARVSLYDARGTKLRVKLLHLVNGLNTLRFEQLDGLPAGTYLVTAEAAGGTVTEKVIKQ
ncbi:MAG TPA: peptide-N-glycosidase F-related protein, partial [Flavisolibacter sp.]